MQPFTHTEMCALSTVLTTTHAHVRTCCGHHHQHPTHRLAWSALGLQRAFGSYRTVRFTNLASPLPQATSTVGCTLKRTCPVSALAAVPEPAARIRQNRLVAPVCSQAGARAVTVLRSAQVIPAAECIVITGRGRRTNGQAAVISLHALIHPTRTYFLRQDSLESDEVQRFM